MNKWCTNFCTNGLTHCDHKKGFKTPWLMVMVVVLIFRPNFKKMILKYSLNVSPQKRTYIIRQKSPLNSVLFKLNLAPELGFHFFTSLSLFIVQLQFHPFPSWITHIQAAASFIVKHVFGMKCRLETHSVLSDPLFLLLSLLKNYKLKSFGKCLE